MILVPGADQAGIDTSTPVASPDVGGQWNNATHE